MVDFDKAHIEIPGVKIALHRCLTDRHLHLDTQTHIAWRLQAEQRKHNRFYIFCVFPVVFSFTVQNVYLLLTLRGKKDKQMFTQWFHKSITWKCLKSKLQIEKIYICTYMYFSTAITDLTIVSKWGPDSSNMVHLLLTLSDWFSCLPLLAIQWIAFSLLAVMFAQQVLC